VDGVPGDDARSTAARGVGWTVLQTWGSRLVTTIVFLVIARIVGPEAIGLAALGLLFSELGKVLIDQGFSQAIVQRQQLDPDDVHSAFWAALGIGALLTGVTALVAPGIAALLGEQEMTGVLRALAPTFVLVGAASVPLGLLQRELAFKALARQRFLGTFLGGAAAIALALAGAGVWSLVALAVVNAFVSLVMVWASVRWRPRFVCSRRRLVALARFGVPVMIIQASDVCETNVDNLIVGAILGPKVLGYYSIAYRVYAVALEVLGTAGTQVATPMFARVSGDPDRLRAGFLSANRICGLLSYGVFTSIVVAAPDIVLVFGSAYAPAGTMLRLLALIAMVAITLWFHRSLVYALGRPHSQLVAIAIGLPLKLGVFLLLAPYGVEVALVAEIAVAMLVVPVTHRLLLGGTGISLASHLRQYAGAAIASVVAATGGFAVAVVAAPLPLAFRLVVTVAATLAVYAAAVLVTSKAEVTDAAGALAAAGVRVPGRFARLVS
jgi:O-antigen/teichoic acid export membrane protein